MRSNFHALGMILFPVGQSVFANLGPDGISMFYVSCIISQLVYSLGGSIFRGGVGSEMVSAIDATSCSVLTKSPKQDRSCAFFSQNGIHNHGSYG